MSFENIVDRIYVITTDINSTRFKGFITSVPFKLELLTVIENRTKDIIPIQGPKGPLGPKYMFKENVGTNILQKNGYAHQLVCIDALENNYKKILLFEDDARFTKSIDTKTMYNIFNWMNNNYWDIFFLGHYPTGLQFVVNKYITRTISSMGVHAVCYGTKIMQLLLNLNYDKHEFNYFQIRDHKNNHNGLDDIIRLECPHLKAYACRPNMFYQYIEPVGVLNVRNFGIFKNVKIEEWPDKVAEATIIITALIFVILAVFFVFCIRLFYIQSKTS
jgi:hypothetical protein